MVLSSLQHHSGVQRGFSRWPVTDISFTDTDVTWRQDMRGEKSPKKEVWFWLQTPVFQQHCCHSDVTDSVGQCVTVAQTWDVSDRYTSELQFHRQRVLMWTHELNCIFPTVKMIQNNESTQKTENGFIDKQRQKQLVVGKWMTLKCCSRIQMTTLTTH